MANGWIPVRDFYKFLFKSVTNGSCPPLIDSSMAHQIFFKSLMGLELDYELLENIRREAASDVSNGAVENHGNLKMTSANQAYFRHSC